MRLVDPQWLLFWPAIPALAGLAWWMLARQKRRAQAFAKAASFARLHEPPSTTRRVMGALLPLLALGMIATALARPQSGTKQGAAERSGAAVALVLDTSLSMATEDVPPSRFLLARRVVGALAERLAGDRLALVSFAGEAQLLSPMTSDYRAIDLMLDGLYPGTVGAPGTAIFRGVMGGIEALKNADPEAGRAMVLITDGEDWSGGLEQAADRLKDAGIKLMVLGVGKETGEPIPIRAPDGEFQAYKYDNKGQVVVSRLEREALERLASAADGEYWTLSSSLREVPLLQQRIEELARASFQEENLFRYSEQYAWLLIPALVLLWIELLWPTAPRRRDKNPSALGTTAVAALALWLILSGFDWGPYRATQKGVAAYSREEYEQAIEQFESALDKAPVADENLDENALLHYNLGAAYYKAGRVDDAIAEWDRAAKMAQDESLRARAHYNAGTASLSKAAAASGQGGAATPTGGDPQADLQRALSRYRRSLELDPADASAKHNFEMATKYLKLLEQQQMQQQQGEQGENKEGEQGAEQAQSAQAQPSEEGEESESGEQGQMAQSGEEQSEEEQQSASQSEQDEQQGKQDEQRSGKGEEREDEESEGLASRDSNEQERDEGEQMRQGSQGAQGSDEDSDQQEGEGTAARSAEEISREEAERILDALAEREREQRRAQREKLQQSRGAHDW